ncbi:MAG: haloacid dehalogenase type II [Thermomicrobium sp.]|nr:haloacid dehalogenase type II [Thermomicrobium sp.]
MAEQGIEAVVFDVYGTLFGFSRLAERAREIVGDLPLLDRWRAKQLEHSFLRTILGEYVDFWRVTEEALDTACAQLELELTAEERRHLLQGWLELEAYPDVEAALDAFRERGWRLAILSNGSPAMLEALLDRAGLRERFDAVLSADAVQRFKPAPAVYALAPASLVVRPERIVFCSSNGFDVAGAIRFGFRVCWVSRGSGALDALGKQPHYTVHSLLELLEHV